jgi:hypothetical protein
MPAISARGLRRTWYRVAFRVARSSDECLLRAMRVVNPPRTVVVRRDSQWLDGELRAWRRDDVGCLGYCCYSESAGLRWLEWVDAERMREAVGDTTTGTERWQMMWPTQQARAPGVDPCTGSGVRGEPIAQRSVRRR